MADKTKFKIRSHVDDLFPSNTDNPREVQHPEEKKSNFTMAPNSILRSNTLSSEAKELYFLMLSYRTAPDADLSEEALLKHTQKGSKAMASARAELMKAGLLKKHIFNKGRSWQQEYELLEVAKPGYSIFYYDKAGNVTKKSG